MKEKSKAIIFAWMKKWAYIVLSMFLLVASGKTFSHEKPDVRVEVAGRGSSSLVTKYPANAAVSGTTQRVFLRPGQVIDRYGSLGGKWFSKPGTSYGSRSIPSGQTPYTQFRVLKPFEVNRSLASPGAFGGQTGFGLQFQSPVGTDILIKRGIIAPFKHLTK